MNFEVGIVAGPSEAQARTPMVENEATVGDFTKITRASGLLRKWNLGGIHRDRGLGCGGRTGLYPHGSGC